MRRLICLALSAMTLLACEDESFVPLITPPPYTIPVLWMWVGPQDEAPPCADGQPPRWEGWMPEEPPDRCDGCACGPAACVLPSRLTTDALSCPGGGSSVSVDAGDGWDGTCAALPSPVAPDELASVLCYPPTLSPCTPSDTPEPPPVAARFVRVCAGDTDDDPPGFIACMQAASDGTCWDGYTRHEFFEELIDDRACAPCECGPPAGGTCVAELILYGDSACTDRVDAALSVGLGEMPCTDIRSSLPLGALRASLVEAEPGACSPSVPAIIGTLERREPHVVCALPET